jgi:hypothetical protein
MTMDQKNHLEEGQLIQAAVDEDELPLSAREHLRACLRCRADKERLSADLAKLGRVANDFSPSPRRRISLPDEKPRLCPGWLRGFRACAGAAAAAGMVAALIWWSGLFMTTPQVGVDLFAEELWEDEEVMAEISALVENALPPEYLDLSGEFKPGFDETFMEFVIPSTEPESLSQEKGKGGTELC